MSKITRSVSPIGSFLPPLEGGLKKLTPAESSDAIFSWSQGGLAKGLFRGALHAAKVAPRKDENDSPPLEGCRGGLFQTDRTHP